MSPKKSAPIERGHLRSTLEKWLGRTPDAGGTSVTAHESDERTNGDTTNAELRSGDGPFSAFSRESLGKADLLRKTGLRPEEYLLRELERVGGHLEQKEIVEYTGWSDSTVSRLLGQMEAQGRIVRVQIGRGNTVYLPEFAPDRGFGSESQTE